MIKTAALAFVLTFAFAASAAQADGDYSVIGAGCQVDPKSAPYTMTNGRVAFAPGGTGATIVLWCPITFTLSPPTTLELQAVDTQAIAAGYVHVAYGKVNANTGGFSLVAGLTSDTITDGLPHFKAASIRDGYDPYNYRYMLKVTLNRQFTNDNIVFLGASVY